MTGIDASLGEVLVAFASAGIQRGLAVINPADGGWIDEDQVKMLFKQAGLASWTFEHNDGVHLRERMYALMDEIQSVLEANANAPSCFPWTSTSTSKASDWWPLDTCSPAESAFTTRCFSYLPTAR